MNNFIDVPGAGAAGAGRAGGAAAAGAAGAGRGNAASDFLQSGSTAGRAAGIAGGAAAGAAVGAAAGRERGEAGRAGTVAENRGEAGRAGTAAENRGEAGRAGTAAENRGEAGRAGTAAENRGEAGRAGTVAENRAQNQPERVENRGERQGERDQRRDEVRNQYNENNPGNFWQENPGWSAWAITRPFAWADWGSVGSWGGYSGEPSAYSYGENIYYADDQVYYGDQPVATTEAYAQQAEAIATAPPSAEPQQGDWLPLGVFAITQDGEASGTQPSLYMQLALSKQGVISGTLKNTLTNKVQSLDGMVDKKSQRVAWSVVDQKRPIIETGLSNLTKDTSAALVHFEDGTTQQWLMVRVEEPKQ